VAAYGNRNWPTARAATLGAAFPTLFAHYSRCQVSSTAAGSATDTTTSRADAAV
jgi:hypothetical protein